MCMGFSGPPYGVPIPPEVYDQYSPELKAAWESFDGWWKRVGSGGKAVSKADMPADVKKAFDLICETEIPGHEGVKGSASCYMVVVAEAFEN